VTIFYVRDYSYTQGDKIPTLVKMELDKGNAMANNDIVTYPLAEGIESMRVDYGVDIDGNGSPDEWHRCDAADPCDNVVQWPNVVTVRIHVLAKNVEETVGYLDQKVYDMGTGLTAFGPFNDRFKRHVYAAVVSLPNRVGPRER
jgi:type IV pilus assembly protein PilW